MIFLKYCVHTSWTLEGANSVYPVGTFHLERTTHSGQADIVEDVPGERFRRVYGQRNCSDLRQQYIV